MSLRRANCLAKINHAGWRGWSCWRVHTCTDHRSRWPSSSCTPRPPRPATSTWRRAESTRHQRTSMCVRHRPIGNSLTRSPVTDISSLLMLWDGPCLSRTCIGLWRVRTGLRPATSLCRTRARLSGAILRAGASLRSRSLLRSGSLLRAGTRLCAGIRAEAAFARTLPFARAMRRRLWQVGLLRLKLPALREFVAIAVTTRRMGGAQRYPSPFRARDRWVSLSLYPSYELSAQFPVYPPVGRGPWNWMPHFFAIEACSTATPR